MEHRTMTFPIARRRKMTRAAALVEAAAVMPVLVVFYGVMVFVFKEYELASILASKSRHAAFLTALQRCRDGHDLDVSRVPFDALPGYERIKAAPYVDEVLRDLHIGTFVDTRAMTAHAVATDIATTAGISQVLREKKLTAESAVTCVPTGFAGGSPYGRVARAGSLSLVRNVMGSWLDVLRHLFETRF